jgi:hypothetical protein
MYELRDFIPQIRIYAGINSSKDLNGNVYEIAKLVYHPDFLKSQTFSAVFRFDIAIIKVSKNNFLILGKLYDY